MPRKGTTLSEEAAANNAAAIKRWHAENTDRISIRVRKEKAAAYRELAKRRQQSLSSIIQQALDAECVNIDLQKGYRTMNEKMRKNVEATPDKVYNTKVYQYWLNGSGQLCRAKRTELDTLDCKIEVLD